jgi:hypothetical protein
MVGSEQHPSAKHDTQGKYAGEQCVFLFFIHIRGEGGLPSMSAFAAASSPGFSLSGGIVAA